MLFRLGVSKKHDRNGGMEERKGVRRGISYEIDVGVFIFKLQQLGLTPLKELS